MIGNGFTLHVNYMCHMIIYIYTLRVYLYQPSSTHDFGWKHERFSLDGRRGESLEEEFVINSSYLVSILWIWSWDGSPHEFCRLKKLQNIVSFRAICFGGQSKDIKSRLVRSTRMSLKGQALTGRSPLVELKIEWITVILFGGSRLLVACDGKDINFISVFQCTV